ncbi:flagellar motor switch protein FliG (plasmid) [Citricoccus nitrophenolicus]
MRAQTMSGTQKVAVLLAGMEPSVATEVMKHFTEDEVHQVSAEIMRMRSTDPDTVDAVFEEMAALLDDGRLPARGGADLARMLVAGAFGDDKTDDVMDRAAGVLAGRAFEFLDDMDANQILALIQDETEQTMAVVLSNLPPKTASSVLSGLDDDARNSVAFRIATMGTPSTEAVQTTAEILKSRVSTVATAREAAQIGGVQSLVSIINRADTVTETGVLTHLDATDEDLSKEVRDLMFTFADMIRLDDRAIQSVMKSVKMDVLAKALRGANPQLDAKIRQNMSNRNVDALDEEIASNPRIRQSEVDESRSVIVQHIRDLEAAGDLDLSVQEEEYV